jgi:succinate dehydrogenase / fumarate reductase flavoprotein subunit
MWDYVGMSRDAEGLQKAIKMIQEIREDFWKDVKVPGELNNLNPELEKAGRVADFIDIGELMARDALDRNESCGGHFREESATEEGEAKRNDELFTYVSCWEYKGESKEPVLHKEDLKFENIKLSQRSYK